LSLSLFTWPLRLSLSRIGPRGFLSSLSLSPSLSLALAIEDSSLPISLFTSLSLTSPPLSLSLTHFLSVTLGSRLHRVGSPFFSHAPSACRWPRATLQGNAARGYHPKPVGSPA